MAHPGRCAPGEDRTPHQVSAAADDVVLRAPPALSTSGLLCREVRGRRGHTGEAGSGCRNSWVLIEAEKGMDSVTRLFTLSVLWATCQVPVPWGHSAGKMLSICRSGT